MSTSRDTRVRVGVNVHAREFDGEMVLLDLERGDYFGLDSLGCAVWKGLAAGESVAQLAERLAPYHDVEPEDLVSDLVALVDELVERRLVVPE